MAQAPKPVKRLYKAGDKPLKIPYEPGEGAAEQCHKQECDINTIVNKYQKTGVIQHQSKHEARYDDMTGEDFHTAMNIVTAAQAMFDELPSHVRKRVDNDPGKFFDYVQNPANQQELIDIGLADQGDFPISPPAQPVFNTTGMEPESTQQQPGTIQKTEGQTPPKTTP